MHESLAHAIRVWHPRTRRALVALVALAAGGAALLYAENALLKGLVEAITRDVAPADGGIAGLAATLAGPTGGAFVLLGAIFAVGLLNAVVNAVRGMASSRLFMTARSDLEARVLEHLLRRDDAFYTAHSAGEILNRLEVDLYRVIQRRTLLADAWWSVLMIVANLLFFGFNDWRLALVVLAMCVAGTLLTRRAGRPVATADRDYFEAHDRVKMDFEDYLGAVPEIQVAGLSPIVLRRLEAPQGRRLADYMRWVRAYTHVGLYRSAWPVASFLLAVLVVLYLYPRAESTTGLALIPVLIYAMPGIFSNASYLVGLNLDYELSGNSARRLLEYETPAPTASSPARAAASASPAGSEANTATPPDGKGAARESDTPTSPAAAPAVPAPAPDVALDDVTFTYTSSDGEPQGGISGVTLRLEPGRWTALAGGAGSGKSTLVNVMLGRVRPQAGAVRFAGGDLASQGADFVPAHATLMPQRVVLLDDTLRANCLLGRGDDADGALDEADFDVLERTGLGAVCRLKALEMRPAPAARPLPEADLATLRREARDRASALGLALVPFEDSPADPSRPFFESLAGGRSDLDGALALLLAPGHADTLGAIARDGLDRVLEARARNALLAQENLLRLPTHDAYARLAPLPLDPTLWDLRRSCLPALADPSPSTRDRLRLFQAGLTARPAEWGATPSALARECGEITLRHDAGIRQLRRLLGPHLAPLDPDGLHPHLCWRDNLLFAATDLANQRRRRLLDDALLDLMGQGSWRTFFLEQGLAFRAGRNGARLSGGQRQLVALARAVLRRTPILVLDEPTSALDPAGRDRVAAFLRDWAPGRVILSISHDPALIRQADRVLVMRQGRLEADGTFDALSEGCEPFRQLMRQG